MEELPIIQKPICDDPDHYLFWDDRHPTAKAYQQIANFALQTLEASCGGSNRAINLGRASVFYP